MLFLALLPVAAAQYTATYTWGQLPGKTEGDGQTGTNACGTDSSPTSMCQNVVINSANDFCLWGPPGTNPADNSIGKIEEIVVAYCLNNGYGTRVFPQGTITSAHFVKVQSDKVSYVQVTGNGDFTKINIPAGDDGGELDPHSWTGLGNPQGGLVFTNAFSGQYEQLHEWTSFQSASNFCLKGCRDGPNAAGYCEHVYDVLGCGFTIPGSFDAGFDDCLGDPAEQPGVYSGSTFSQGDPTTPAPHPAGPTSQCTAFSTVGGGQAANFAAASGSASSSSNGTATATASGSMTSATSMSTTITSSASSSSASGPSRSSMGTGSSRTTSGGPSGTALAATSSGAAGRSLGGALGVGSLVGVVMMGVAGVAGAMLL